MNKKVTAILEVKDKHFGGFKETKVFTEESELEAYLNLQKKCYSDRPYSTTATITVFDENDNFIGFEQLC